MPLALARRQFLQLFASGAAAAWLTPACSYFPPESGPAFEPWSFPEPAEPVHVEVARAAILAASPHNTQPWSLRVSERELELHANLARNLGSMDSLRRELHIGLGCALENMLIAARARGASPELSLFPDAEDPSFVARIALRASGTAGAADGGALVRQIAQRHTNRGPYVAGALAKGLDAELQSIVVQYPGLQLRALTKPSELAQFRAQTIAATRAIIDDAEMSADSDRWYRHSQREIQRERDGVTLDATGNGAATRFFGKSLGRPDIATANAYWLDATRAHQTEAAYFGLITSTAANTRAEQLQTGRAFQHLQLWAASEGLAVQPLNQLAERQDREQSRGLAPVFSRALEDLIGARDRRAQMSFRIGYPVDHAFASPRRPLAWVLL